MPHRHHENQLDNIMGWLLAAKQNLPAINDGQVTPDRISQMSALLDRLHASANGLRLQIQAERRRRAA